MSATVLATVAAALAVAAGLLAPGALALRGLGLGATRLERFVLSVALGRCLLGAAGLVAAETGTTALLPALAALALASWIALAWRERRARRTETPLSWRAALPAAIPLLAAFAVVVAVVARSGWLEADGALVFRGEDASDDPLFYLATAAQLAALGLPLQNPLAADFPIVGHALFYGTLVALRAIGDAALAPFDGAALATLLPLSLVFRALPLLDLGALVLTGYALVRALGGSPAGAAIGATAMVLGGGAFLPLRALLELAGLPVRDLLAWALFGPLLLPVNPVTPALQLAFAAALLLARLPRDATRAALVAGALVAAAAEFKIFAWAPVLGALVLVAWLRPPADLARPLRLASVVAGVASLPGLLEKLLFASRLDPRFAVGFGACPGCLPRYLVEGSLGGADLGFARFEGFRARDLAAPETAAVTLGATLLFLAVALGARWLALPTLLRGCRTGGGSTPGSVAVLRWLAAASVLGLGLAMSVGAAPHYLNGGQFAWPALLGLWLVLGLAAGRWVRDGRWIVLAVALVLAGSSSLRTLWRMGVEAPALLRVEAPEQALLRALAERAAPGDVVLEPSWLHAPAKLAPATWLAGQRVYLSSDDAAAYLAPWERLFRLDNLRRIYETRDAERVGNALRATGARWLLAPAGMEPPAQAGLQEVFRNEAGALYRIPGDGS